MTTLTFNNTVEQSSDMRSGQGIFIMKTSTNANNNIRNSKMRNGNEIKVTQKRGTVRFFSNTAKWWELTQAVQRVKSLLLARYKLDTGIQLISTVLVDTKMDTKKLVSGCQLIIGFLVETRVETFEKVRSKYAQKTNLLMRTNLIIKHIRTARIELSESIKKENYVADLANFSRQVAITQAEKLLFSFFACSSISSIKSWGKRIFFNCDLLFLLPVTIVNSLLYKIRRLKNSNKKALTCLHTKIYIGIYTPNKLIGYKKQCPEVLPTLSRHLTTNIKDTNAMANSNNTLHPKNGQQSKLFKFYDLSTDQVVQSIAPTERQACKNLGRQSLIFIARIRLYPIIESYRTQLVNRWAR